MVAQFLSEDSGNTAIEAAERLRASISYYLLGRMHGKRIQNTAATCSSTLDALVYHMTGCHIRRCGDLQGESSAIVPAQA